MSFSLSAAYVPTMHARRPRSPGSWWPALCAALAALGLLACNIETDKDGGSGGSGGSAAGGAAGSAAGTGGSAAGGAGGSSAGGSAGAMEQEVVRSCVQLLDTCTEFHDVPEGDVMTICSSGEVKQGPCSRTSAVGGCRKPYTVGYTILWLYNDGSGLATTESTKQSCVEGMPPGTFVDP